MTTIDSNVHKTTLNSFYSDSFLPAWLYFFGFYTAENSAIVQIWKAI